MFSPFQIVLINVFKAINHKTSEPSCSKQCYLIKVDIQGFAKSYSVHEDKYAYPFCLTLLHLERPKLHTILAFLSAMGL